MPENTALPFAVDDIILTPRTIDQAALDGLTGSLRGLIEGAKGESRTLREAVGEVRGLGGTLRTLLNELRARAERSEASGAALRELIDQAERIDEQRIAAKVGEAVDRATAARLNEFDRQIAERTETLRVLQRSIEQSRAVIERLADPAAIERTVRERASAVIAGLADEQVRVWRERVESESATLSERLEAIAARSEALRAAQREWTISIGEEVSQLEKRLAAARATLERLEQTDARALTATLDAAASRCEELDQLASRVRQSSDAAHLAASDLAAIREQADLLRSLLASQILEGAELADRIAAECQLKAGRPEQPAAKASKPIRSTMPTRSSDKAA
jgi:hypothetical protein